MNQLEELTKHLAPNLVQARASITQHIAAAVLARHDYPSSVDIEVLVRASDEYARQTIEAQLSMPDAEDWAATQIMKNMDPETVAELIGGETKQ